MGRREFYSCDRCGKEWEYEIKNGFGNNPKHLDYEPLRRVDLCVDCYQSFYDVISKWEKFEKIEKE